MEDKNKTQITAIFFIVLSIIFSFLFWISVERIIATLNAGSWLQSVLLFSACFVSWSIGVILVKNNGWLKLASLLVVFSGVPFVLNWKYVIITIFSALLIWVATIYIKKEMDSRLEISVWHFLRVGRRFFIIAIALVLASHYYFNYFQTSEDKNIPEIKIGEQQTWLATKIISAIDPDLSAKEMENLTIDEFILKKVPVNLETSVLQNNEQLDDKNVIPNGIWDNLTGGINIEEMEEAIILQENKKGISEMAGKEIEGNEKMIDVVSEIVNNKINEIIIPKKSYSGQTSLIIPWVLASILFLTVASFGTFISSLLIFIVWILFKILVKLKLVTIEKKETIKEVI